MKYKIKYDGRFFFSNQFELSMLICFPLFCYFFSFIFLEMSVTWQRLSSLVFTAIRCLGHKESVLKYVVDSSRRFLITFAVYSPIPIDICPLTLKKIMSRAVLLCVRTTTEIEFFFFLIFLAVAFSLFFTFDRNSFII